MEQLFLAILQAFTATIATLGGIVVVCMGLLIIFTNMTIKALIVGVFVMLIGGCLIAIGVLVSTI